MLDLSKETTCKTVSVSAGALHISMGVGVDVGEEEGRERREPGPRMITIRFIKCMVLFHLPAV